MRKLSEFRGDEAIEVLADLIEPATTILSDPEARGIVGDGSKVKIITYILKHHKESVLQIMAVLDGVDITDKKAYTDFKKSVNILTLPVNLLAILNDPDVQSLFQSQGLTMGVQSSTPASVDLQAEI